MSIDLTQKISVILAGLDARVSNAEAGQIKPALAFANPTASVTEGNSGTSTVSNTINVTRNGVTGPLTINLTYGGTATSGTDYVAGPVSGTIADGQSSLTFDLTLNGDVAVESDETIIITAALAGYAATASKTITIGNDDSATTLPAFAYNAKTASATNAMTARGYTPSAAYQRFMDAQFRRLDTAGITPLLTQLWIAHPQDALFNLVSPGTNDPVKVGAVSWTSPVAAIGAANPLANVIGYSTSANANYIDSVIQYGTLNPADFTMGFYRGYAAAGTGFDMGVADGTAGVLIVAQSTSNSSTMAARLFSASIGTTGTSSDWDGTNFHAIRSGTDGRTVWHNAKKVSTNTAATTVAAATPTLTINQLRANGATGPSAAGHLAGFVASKALTDAQMRTLYSVIRTWVEEVIWGSVDFHEPGYSPSQTTYDGIAYGMTLQSVCTAIEAKRQGLSVAIVGGWNETSRTHIGGMSGNGLGEFDVDHPESVGGLTRTFITRARAIDGASDGTLKFNPGSMNKVLRQALAAAGIPVYATGAMPTCSRSGGLFTLAPGDGRSFTSTFLEDNSYEGDVLAALNIPLVNGREAAGASGIDATVGGFRGVTATNGGNLNQFATSPTVPGTLWPVDPFITPGDAASGLVAGVAGPMPTIALGSATNETQSYNFRVTLTASRAQQVPWDQFFNGVPPEGYAAANYEALKRQAALQTAAGGGMVLADLLKVSTLYKGKTDCNNQGGMSTDLMGSGTAYVAAGRNSSARLQVLKNVRNNILGLFYDILYSGDARYPAALVTALQGYGFADDHYLNPGANDLRFFPGVLYVREHSRLAAGLNGAFWSGNDATAADGAAPRISANTGACASYSLDSHHMQRYWATIGGVNKLWLEGNMFAVMGGSNGVTPVPLEITVPDEAVMPNVSTAWSVACNHNAFGTYRMEGCSGQMGQSHGAGWAVAKTRGVTLQAALTIYYADVKALMNGDGDAVAPYLPVAT